VAVVFNPRSGVALTSEVSARRRAIRSALAMHESRALWFETTTLDPGQGCVKRALAGGAGLILACGGDGTVMACAAALTGTGVPLAVIPGGTGNIIAASLKLPAGVSDAVLTALHGGRQLIDVGISQEDHAFFAAGIGFGAAVMRDATPAWKRRAGMFAYLYSAARHVLDPPRTFCVWLDDQPPFIRRSHGILVGNFGELMSRSRLPHTALDDGMLEVGILTVRPLLDWARRDHPVVHTRRPPPLDWHQAARIRVTCDVPQPTERDGEFTGWSEHLSARVLADSLEVCVPSHSGNVMPGRRLIHLLARDVRRLKPWPRIG
jgi:diacylglycerol kinase family enzyme